MQNNIESIFLLMFIVQSIIFMQIWSSTSYNVFTVINILCALYTGVSNLVRPKRKKSLFHKPAFISAWTQFAAQPYALSQIFAFLFCFSNFQLFLVIRKRNESRPKKVVQKYNKKRIFAFFVLFFVFCFCFVFLFFQLSGKK